MTPRVATREATEIDHEAKAVAIKATGKSVVLNSVRTADGVTNGATNVLTPISEPRREERREERRDERLSLGLARPLLGRGGSAGACAGAACAALPLPSWRVMNTPWYAI